LHGSDEAQPGTGRARVVPTECLLLVAAPQGFRLLEDITIHPMRLRVAIFAGQGGSAAPYASLIPADVGVQASGTAHPERHCELQSYEPRNLADPQHNRRTKDMVSREGRAEPQEETRNEPARIVAGPPSKLMSQEIKDRGHRKGEANSGRRPRRHWDTGEYCNTPA
jgi:hypothetical protein